MSAVTSTLPNPDSAIDRPIVCSIFTRATWRLNTAFVTLAVVYVMLAYTAQLKTLNSTNREELISKPQIVGSVFLFVLWGGCLLENIQDYRRRHSLEELLRDANVSFESRYVFGCSPFPPFRELLFLVLITPTLLGPFTSKSPDLQQVSGIFLPGISILSSVFVSLFFLEMVVLVQPERLVIIQQGVLWEQAFCTTFIPWTSLRNVTYWKWGKRLTFHMECQPAPRTGSCTFNMPILATGEQDRLLELLKEHISVIRK